MHIPVGTVSIIIALTFASGLGRPCAASPKQETITIQPSGAVASVRGGAENFTGAVRIDPLIQDRPPSRMSGALVTFEPGSRTAWHTHPLGQTLIVTAGVGRIQQAGGPVQEMRSGDVVRIPPGVRHWHGAAATIGMNHIALAEALDGKVVDWMEPVTDAEFRGE